MLDEESNLCRLSATIDAFKDNKGSTWRRFGSIYVLDDHDDDDDDDMNTVEICVCCSSVILTMDNDNNKDG